MSPAVVRSFGFEVIYGDTDSVMYNKAANNNSDSLVSSYVNYINRTYVDIKPTDIIEFSNGNEAAMFSPRNIHLASLCNKVVKVLNSSK